jgi:hypothetical protein
VIGMARITQVIAVTLCVTRIEARGIKQQRVQK